MCVDLLVIRAHPQVLVTTWRQPEPLSDSAVLAIRPSEISYPTVSGGVFNETESPKASRRAARSAGGGVALLEGRTCRAQLCRPRLDPEIHRAQLASRAAERSQPRQ